MNNSTQLFDTAQHNETTTLVSACALLTINFRFPEISWTFSHWLLCNFGALPPDDLKQPRRDLPNTERWWWFHACAYKLVLCLLRLLCLLVYVCMCVCVPVCFPLCRNIYFTDFAKFSSCLIQFLHWDHRDRPSFSVRSTSPYHWTCIEFGTLLSLQYQCISVMPTRSVAVCSCWISCWRKVYFSSPHQIE